MRRLLIRAADLGVVIKHVHELRGAGISSEFDERCERLSFPLSDL